MAANNGHKDWELRRAKILLFAGIIGMFSYFFCVEFLNVVWHVEWLLGFLSMMGLGLFQAIDKTK